MSARALGLVTRGAWIFGAVLGLAGLASASAHAQVSPARWVEADALAYLEVVRPETLIEHANSPRVRDLLAAAPGLDERLKNPQLKQLQTVAELVASQIDVELEQGVRDLTAGGIALALEGRDKVERVVLIVTPRDPDLLRRAHDRLLALARADATSKGKADPVAETDHNGVTTYSVSPQEAHAIVADRLVVANGLEPLKAVLDRVAKAPESTLADDPNFRARRDEIGPDALAFAFARLAKLRAIDPKSYGGEMPDTGGLFLLGPWYDSLRNAEWASASLTWTDARLALEMFLPPPPEGYDDALARYRPEPGQGAAPPIHVPGQILSASLWRDFAAIWEVREEIFPPETLQNLAQLDTLAGTFFGGRDFGTGVLGSLGHDWRLVVANQDYEAMDPSPDVKLPGFALVVGLKPDDDEFALRLKSAFQSFIGLVNLGGAQEKSPPLMLGSETVGDVTIARSSYLPPNPGAEPDPDTPVDTRYNFSPSAAQVGDTFILGSSVGLTRDLVAALQDASAANADPTGATLVAEADADALARLVAINRDRLAMNSMLEKGSTRANAEAEIDLIARLLRYLHHGRLGVEDRPEGARLVLEFDLATD